MALIGWKKSVTRDNGTVEEEYVHASAENPLPVEASVVATAQTVAKATASAPTYSEGQEDAPLSVDLAGGLRITGTINASSSLHSTTAAPSYVNGTDNAFSSNLTGDLRTIAKQSGTWTVGIDQGTPGTTNAVDATNFPDTLDVNSGNKSNSTIRVVLATDQPALSNKLLVTPDLPSGAATAAKQPALGTAGTPSTDVITVQGSASGTAIPVSLASVPSHAVTNAGTFAVQAAQSGTWTVGISASQTIGVTNFPTTVDTNSGNKSASTLRTLIATDALAVPLWGHGATGASVPANAVYMGGRTLSATPTDTTAQMNAPVLDIKGSQIVQPYGLGDNCISGLTSAMTGTTSTAVTGIGAPGSGLYNYITQLTIGNSHATVGTFVELQDGSGGTTFYTVPAAAVYGGATITFPKPLKQPTANTALYCKNTTTGANVIVSASGFKGP